MPSKHDVVLSRRETQIMEIIYRKKRATALEILEELADPPSYSAIRALLAILEKKGHVKHTKDGAKYVYLPIRSRQQAAQSALKRLLQTFFEGSTEKAVAALLDQADSNLSDVELERLSELIDNAKKESR